MRLRTRVALLVAAAVVLTVGVVAAFAYRSTRAEALAEIDRSLLGRVPGAGLAELVSGRPGPGGAMRRAEVAALISDDALAQVVRPDSGILVLGSTDRVLPVEAEDLAVAADATAALLRTIELDGTRYRMISRGIPGTRLVLQVARDLSETEALLAGLRNRLLLIGLTGAAAAGLLGWWLAGRAVRPVEALTRAAEQVRETGALDTPIVIERQDEIGRLAAAFNTMLARLDEMQTMQRRLVADASHELRTPLTSVRTNIELLARGGLSEADQQEMLGDLRTEVAELGDLVGELVDLAIVGRAEETPEIVDLVELVESVVDRMRRRSGLAFEVAATPVTVTARRGDLARAVTNLVDNAVKWSPPGGAIAVDVGPAEVAVRDHGPGFAPEDIPLVFERFYRAVAARNLPGSGLGLAIVAAVAEDHGWTVFAGNHPDGGARVGIRLGD